MIVAETDRMISERLEPSLAGGRCIDIYPLGKDLVLAITVKAFFGNGLEHRTAEIGVIFDELQAYLELPGFKQLPHRIPFTRRSRARAARHAFDRIVDEEVARRRRIAASDFRDDETGAGDLLDVFIHDSTGDITNEEIHDQVNTLIGAGYNTTAATLAWTLQRALTTPGVWQLLRSEAAVAFSGDLAPSSETLHRLPYATAVARETLRLHPAGSFAPRQAITDITVGSHTIRKNTLILWSPHLAGRDAHAWLDPLGFRPERHVDPSAETAATMDAAWVPFGRGPRRCIGFALAQMELTVILARLAHRLDLRTPRSDTPRPYGTVVNRPKGGVIVQRMAPGEPKRPEADAPVAPDG